MKYRACAIGQVSYDKVTVLILNCKHDFKLTTPVAFRNATNIQIKS